MANPAWRSATASGRGYHLSWVLVGKGDVTGEGGDVALPAVWVESLRPQGELGAGGWPYGPGLAWVQSRLYPSLFVRPTRRTLPSAARGG